VFFLTIGGIVALLMGFGFLLNFVSDSMFEAAKSITTGIAAGGFVWWGTRLSHNEKLRDFGSAMIALGVSVNYLLIYFLSNSALLPFFGSEWFGLLLVTLNTAFAYFLAMRFETRIVLVLSLLGGAMAPFYLSSTRISVFYFIFLWILVVSTVIIAEKTAWRWAIYLTFVLVVSIFEGSIFSWNSDNIQEGIWLGLSSLFAYTFYYTSFFEKGARRTTFSPQDVLMLAANTVFFIVNLNKNFEFTSTNYVLGSVFLLNSLPFVVYFLRTKAESLPNLHSILVLLAATFAAFSVPVFFEMRINGVVWGLEAILLTVLGFTFGYVNIRKEAYILFVIAVAGNFFSFWEIGDNWGTKLFTDGFLNLTGLCINLFFLFFILKKNEAQSQNFEKIFAKMALSGGFWSLSALAWVSAFFYAGVVFYNFAVLFIFLFLFLGARFENRGIILLAYSQIAFLIWSYILSVETAGDMAFRFQNTFAQAALTEMYLSLWLIYFFYEKVIPNAPMRNFAYVLRVCFYVAAPVMMLPSAWRFYNEYFSSAMWASVGAAYLVYRFTDSKLILTQLYITAAAALYFYFTALGTTTEQAFLWSNAVCAGVCLLLWVGEKGFLKPEYSELGAVKFLPTRLLLAASVYQFSVVLLFGGMQFIDRSGDIFWLSLLFFALVSSVAERTRALHGTSAFLWGSLQFFQTIFLMYYVIFAYFQFRATDSFVLLHISGITGLMIYNFLTVYRSSEQHFIRKAFGFNIWALHLQIMLAYWGVIVHIGNEWTGLLMTIVMILHAILLIFNSTMPSYGSLIRLSVLIFVVSLVKLFFMDLAAYGAVQKIIVMMVIGVLMLIGSFAYAKYKSKK
jgi:hypothetical protein